MLGTDLAYVRAKLQPLKRPARIVVAKKTRMSLKTLYRLAAGTSQGRGDTVGKLAMYFRTQEKRAA